MQTPPSSDRYYPLAVALLFLTCIPVAALAAQGARPSIGVVTAVRGEASVSREASPSAVVLRFKDDVFFRDAITTKERATVRLLLGGKGVLTIREQSEVILEETEGPQGGRRSIITLFAGKVGAVVARELMRAGDAVDIRTPNAVAAVRGTVFIVEYVPAAPIDGAEPGNGGTTSCVVLSGRVAVTPQGAATVMVASHKAVEVVGPPAAPVAGPVLSITPADVPRALQGLEIARPLTRTDGGETIAKLQLESVAGSLRRSVDPADEKALRDKKHPGVKDDHADDAAADPKQQRDAKLPGGSIGKDRPGDAGRPAPDLTLPRSPKGPGGGDPPLPTAKGR
jgi:hypothetical protein